MKLEELYKRLIEDDFKDPATGNLFFPVYLYLYPPQQEFEMRKEIGELGTRISKPNEFLKATILDIFDLFTEFLEQTAYGKKMNLLEFHLHHTLQRQLHQSLRRNQCLFHHLLRYLIC